MKQYEVKYADLPNGETMAYRETGSGPLLVLIHGNQSSSVYFQRTMEAFEDSARVIAPDLIGFGDSSYKSRKDSLRDFAEDLKEFFEVLDLRDAVALGWSTGGGILLELSLMIPERLKHLLLLDSVGLKGLPFPAADKDGKLDKSRYVHKRKDIESHPILYLPVKKAFRDQNDAFFRRFYNKKMYNLHSLDEREMDLYIDALLKEKCINDVDVALANFNFTDEDGITEGSGGINQLEVPVTIIHGKEDRLVPVTEAYEMNQMIPDSDLIVLSDAGHSLFTDRPETFYNLLRPYL